MDPIPLGRPSGRSRGGHDGSRVHALTGVNETTRTGTCSICGHCLVRPNGFNYLKRRIRQRRWRCGNVAVRVGVRVVLPYSQRKDCERCGFRAEDPCQIDIHHLNGDRYDNRSENLRFLCANCHRLITKQERWESTYATSPLQTTLQAL